MTQERRSTVLKWLIILVTAAGISIHVQYGLNEYGGYIFWFFTVISNLFVLVFYTWKGFSQSPMSYRIKGFIVEPIILTGILNWFILVPIAIQANSVMLLFHPTNFFVHGLTPFLVFIDWFLYDPKHIYKKYDALRWCVFPILYMIAVYIRAWIQHNHVFNGSDFPYPFLDRSIMGGVGNLILVLGLIFIVYLGVGHIMVKFKGYRTDKWQAAGQRIDG